ncbi:hypothetical protein CROQUDRAFT_38946 [Cronartium quercuum f. sp. fusiforme G11]|uniref:Uncharacterized protein n=1 Tax=Cronartium quercuum f. sp. fusiforme G11 TaxID=708437 RepID=A0A9P6NMT2_9BASI|nr:hypothetical protein CROQUDRAFT_38946 [Cronartium quercuum f. sp. fusiforme G11]
MRTRPLLWILVYSFLHVLLSPGLQLADVNPSTQQPHRLTSPYPDGQLFFQPSTPSASANHNVVPVALGVMSKCPDAQICEDVFDRVLAEVSDKVELTVVYMGDLDDTTGYGVRCRHGDNECRANIQQLCYRAIHPSLHDWWSFIQCQNYAGLPRVGDEDLARSCAKLNGHGWKEVRKCVEGAQGRTLLRSSVLEARDLHVLKSCSIYLNRQLVCMHDSSWKQCPSGHTPSDFISLIKEEYEKINP